jgi:Ca-activated chloride channel family protein
LSGGAAAYRAGQFPQAARAFQESITRAPSGSARRLAEQQDAYYNLGNTLYRAGQKTEQSSREATLARWNEAVKAYDTALQLRPDDADSRYNREFVQHKIDALRQEDPPKSPPQGGGGKTPPGAGSSKPPSPPRSGAPPPGGTPPEAASSGAAPPAAPGSMSAEEARELLDSAKGEERNGLGAAAPPKSQAPEKPYKNW